MSTTTISDLHQIVTPALLTKVHELHSIPGPKAQPSTSATSATISIPATMITTMTGDLACLESAIRPMLTSGVDNLPADLLQFLPPLESPDFPVLCSSLILLFDQASSHLFEGAERGQAKRAFNHSPCAFVSSVSLSPPTCAQASGALAQERVDL